MRKNRTKALIYNKKPGVCAPGFPLFFYQPVM